MTKKAIFFIILLIILFSSVSGYGGYFYGVLATKKKAEVDKEAAIKGAIYDAKETLSKEAIEKAMEQVGNTGGEKKEAVELIHKYFGLLNEKKFDEAYELVSSDYKKTLYSVNGLKKDLTNTKELKVSKVEFRSEGESTSLYSVDITKILSSDTTKEESLFVRIAYDSLRDKWSIDGVEKKEEEKKSTKKEE